MRKQQVLIEDFRRRIKDVLANEGNVNEEEYDNHLQSFKAESFSEINLLNEEVIFADKELEELRKIEAFEGHSHDKVEFGTVVVTDQRNFFVSASLEDFEVDGMKVFGISVNAPLYTLMKGKKVGQKFKYNGNAYTIQDIF